ncbi:MAG TPA: glycine--tRNA ligase subunit beta [Gammaproteobacteria bacterium]|nr:glycine--tRNA ligase subunit beta [Gammaproteobacteria bacterium]
MAKKKTRADLLLEVGTEELPPRALLRLGEAFAAGIEKGLADAGLAFRKVRMFCAPRRLAVVVDALQTRQADQAIERRGPALKAAFDEDGCPSKAAQGFARSCGVAVEDLEKLETEQGAWLVYRTTREGADTATLIPDILRRTLDQLPVPRRMRWGDLDEAFVRPVHWLVALLGRDTIEFEMFGIRSGRESRGHRFHHPDVIVIPAPDEYETLLESHGRVIADFDRRRTTVRGLVEEAVAHTGGKAVIDDDLLDEVTAMVEWPVPVVGNFEERFLDVPPEVLITTMKTNQKYFHVLGQDGRLLPYFVTISNIDSREPERVREGNERVVRPRLSDAEFFWNQDRKQTLASHVESLKSVVFQKKLGTLHDKMRRIASLAGDIAADIGGDRADALRAAELCKCDLMTEMVYEFPELQGVMGRYYASHDGEPDAVATAIEEHYLPRFAGDRLPETPVGQALAIADKLDTVVGIFAAGQAPTGDRDPFALRRAALGIMRILLERRLELDLTALIRRAAEHLPDGLGKPDVVEAVHTFMLDRLRGIYVERGVPVDLFEAVAACEADRPLDMDRRIAAVGAFRELPEAESLAAANKRISNILKKAGVPVPENVDTKRFTEDAEQALFDATEAAGAEVAPLLREADYTGALRALAALRAPVDRFFDEVMVMAEDTALRDNRLALLQRLHGLFLGIADISRLQT